MRDPFSVAGRVALVTGAASGIGRASAIALARSGAIVVCADLDGEGAAATALAAENGSTSAILDIADSGAVERLVDGIVADLGRLDVMVANAGTMSSAKVLDLTAGEIDRVFDVNVKGTLFCIQSAARAMTRTGQGSIVTMASAAIDVPGVGISAYAMSKAAIAQLTKAAAAELGELGIRVNAIAPGFVETAITERHYLLPDGSYDEDRREQVLGGMRSQSPLGLMGVPDDIAWAVLYLASEASRFVTGQVIRPNGGIAMPG
ncbi:MAG: short-chain dehydrogenase/reductase [Subtercola sp.]|nr:short-chain dehydrogenase/reductase [Subtercola sp.]